MASPYPKEPLLVYLVSMPNVVSLVLVAERGGVQKHVYYVGEVLHEPKERYPQVHKLLYDILMASRKIRHYFHLHKIIVPSSFPLRSILHNKEATSRIAMWAVELGEFDIHFVAQTTIKSQALADFIVE